MKPKHLPEKPKNIDSKPLELSCPKCKADQEHIELLDGEDAFYCNACDSKIYDPVGTQPVKTQIGGQMTKKIISSDMLTGD